jgi:phosphate transport system protein
MWSELVELFRPGNPMEGLSEDFGQMYSIAAEMAGIVEPHIFDHSLTLEQRSRIYKLDIKVNKLERSIRKRVVAHVTTSKGHIPYCLLLMSLVKDVERIGDYIKNISEVSELGGGPIPEGDLRTELADLVNIAMELMNEAYPVFDRQDTERAHELLQLGQSAGKRCDQLLVALARSDFNATQTTSMVLLTRFYKRVGGHLMNMLSGVLMPVHKVDFYDERITQG